MIAVRVLHGGAVVREQVLSALPVRVGRGPENDVVLFDPSVSRAHAVIEARNALEASARHTLPEQLHYESERQRELIDQPAFAEGVAAFLQKRAPEFPGR